MHPPLFDLFFTGRDDPRCCVIIGEDTKPVYFCLETAGRSHPLSCVRTIVYRNNKEVCAYLDWSPGNHLGSVTIAGRQLPMSQLVQPGSNNNARSFSSADGHLYEWRRIQGSSSYDLFTASSLRLALYRPYAQATPVGPSHGLLQYTFSDDLLLVEALLALCLNRWIDLNGV